MFIKSGLSSGGLFVRWYRELTAFIHKVPFVITRNKTKTSHNFMN